MHPQNVTYFLHMSQNEIISILSSLITEIICRKVHAAKYFSYEYDKVTSHNKAFMSIILTMYQACPGVQLERKMFGSGHY